MARIAGVNIPVKKRVLIALTYIHGIGRKMSSDILKAVNIDESRRVNELTLELALDWRWGLSALRWTRSDQEGKDRDDEEAAH